MTNVTTNHSNDGHSLHIIISGVLNNEIHSDFRSAYENNPSKHYIVDLSMAQNIDSSGLGMLLLLRDFAGGEDARVSIINSSKHILDIFNVTCFHRLFQIPNFAP